MRRLAKPLLPVVAASIPLALMPSPAAAYLGPGGALSFLTTALAMLAVFSVSAAVVVTRQVRAVKAFFRRRRNKSKSNGNGDEQEPEHSERRHDPGGSGSQP
jgi:hypothetical protein